MDYLWTPWRYQYVTKGDAPVACVFCVAAGGTNDRESLIVHRAKHNFIILNRFPYTNGHVMVVPYKHIATLQDSAEEALPEMMHLARECEKHLRALYHPDGLNIGMNLGQSAGAGIANHIHMHILPRWVGDTNFMTVTGETRVMPEVLATTWEKLSSAGW